MPLKTNRKHHKASPKHKHTKKYLQAYWPYIPMLAIIGIGLIMGGGLPFNNTKGVLSYAIEISSTSLLNATNIQRQNNGQNFLTLNNQLNSAAQAKANDMVNKNYWSHNTPDGQEPWVFIANTNYSYFKAGENLAYGFTTSNDTVLGWMNSPTHKANIIDSAFTEVGFGFANGSNYNQSGPETVVVAMYAKPQVLATSNTNAPSVITPPAPAVEKSTSIVTSAKIAEAKTTDNSTNTEPGSISIKKLDGLTKGSNTWLAATIVIIASVLILYLLIKHGVGFAKLIKKGEGFALKHPALDTLLVSIIMVCYILSTTKGIIK